MGATKGKRTKALNWLNRAAAEKTRGEGIKPLYLVAIDASYSLSTFKSQGNLTALHAREVGDLFDHVWSVHPVGGVIDSGIGSQTVGPPALSMVGYRHTFISGMGGRYGHLKKFQRTNQLLALLSLLRNLRKLARRMRPAVVRSGDPSLNGLLGYLVSRASHAMFVIRVSGDPDELRKRTGTSTYPRIFPFPKVEKRLERLLLRRADAVVTPTDHYAQWAVNAGADPRKCRVIGFTSLLDDRFFTKPVPPRANAGNTGNSQETHPFILCVSRLEAVKRVRDIPKIAERLLASNPKLQIWAAGEGTLRPELEEEIAIRGLQGRLHLVGLKSQDWLLEAYDTSVACLVLQGGRVLVEAALRQAPIVAYDDDWHSEFLLNGESCMFVPRDDWCAASDALDFLVRNPTVASSLGRHARLQALAERESVDAVSMEREFYLDLLRRGTRSFQS